MAKVITLTQKFLKGHPKAGEDTDFIYKFLHGFKDEDWYYDYCYEAGFKLGFEYDGDFMDKVEAFMPKSHTIRANNRFKQGDMVSIRTWGNDINPKSGRSGAYHSKQIILAPDLEVKKVYKFERYCGKFILEDKVLEDHELIVIAANDGLTLSDFKAWFTEDFNGQIICWGNVNY